MSEQYPGQIAEVPVIENMIESWKQFQGQTVNGEFELRDYLGGSTHSAVFLTEYDHQVAAIHVISENAADRERQLASWQLATELSHPNLIRVYQVGLCQLANERCFYAVMELPDENLGQILTQRALTAEETTAMLGPALDALAFLHKRDIVHHSINAANIGALGDKLKLSVGTLARAGEANSHPGLYDPPETVSTPAADVWSLGLTIVEVLTQRVPTWQRDAQGDPDITASLPQPLFDIARNCLRRDARRRLTVRQIAARLNPSAPAADSATEIAAPVLSVPEAKQVSPAPATPTKSSPSISRAEATTAASVSSHVEPPQPRSSYTHDAAKVSSPQRQVAVPQASRSNSSYRTPIIIVVLLIAAFAGYRFFFSSHTAAPGSAVSTPQEVQSNANDTPPPSGQIPAPTPQPSAAAPESAPASTRTPAAQPIEKAKPASKSTETSATNSEGSSGSVVHQALPEIPEKALNSIHGRFHVIVRAASDAAGKVSDASIDSPGPSQYFANLALKAARDWKFSPSSPGEWLIRFEFTSDGATASAAPAQ